MPVWQRRASSSRTWSRSASLRSSRKAGSIRWVCSPRLEAGSAGSEGSRRISSRSVTIYSAPVRQNVPIGEHAQLRRCSFYATRWPLALGTVAPARGVWVARPGLYEACCGGFGRRHPRVPHRDRVLTALVLSSCLKFTKRLATVERPHASRRSESGQMEGSDDAEKYGMDSAHARAVPHN